MEEHLKWIERLPLMRVDKHRIFVHAGVNPNYSLNEQDPQDVIWKIYDDRDGVTAHAETDVFVRTVGFALTGSDVADPKVIGNRAKCVFAINNDIFPPKQYTPTASQSKDGSDNRDGAWVTVELHGDDVVFEETTEPLKDDGL